MRDAIGGSVLLNLVIIFASVIILFFVGIIAYSKAYGVKNKIIEIVEKYNGDILDVNGNLDNNVESVINEELRRVGYRVTNNSSNCSNDSSRGTCDNLNTSTYQYCLCQQAGASDTGVSYEVITYVHFDFPVIGDVISIPVNGETKIFKTY